MNRITISIEPDQLELLRNRARTHGRSISSEINQLIQLALLVEAKGNIEFIRKIFNALNEADIPD